MTERKPRAKRSEPAPRANRARAVGDMLPTVGGASFRRFGFVQSSVVSRWAEIVGPKYAGVTAPESIRFPHGKRADGVLTLSVDSGHAAMMQHVAPVIVERVNRFFGYPAVARVAIRQGVIARTPARRVVPALKPVSTEIGDSLRGIGDPELRACLEGLASALAATREIPVLGRIGEQRK